MAPNRAIIVAAIIAITLVVIFVVRRQQGGYVPVPPPPVKKLYTLDTDLSGGKLKPGNGPSSMRFFLAIYPVNEPTNGTVNYGAWDDLITVTPSGKTIIAAGPVGAGGRRNMIRLTSAKTYDNGLFVISADHIPEGLGTWPSFWLTAAEPSGSVWACNGEIDIIEGVNSINANSSRNASTLHTSDKPGAAPCRQIGVPGISNDGNCTAGTSTGQCGCNRNSGCPTLGCGVMSASTTSFGKGFNDAGGGTYACELTPAGAVTIWFFPVGTEPADLKANDPHPSTWPATNRIVFNPCPGQFAKLQMVLNCTLCGDWAGAENVYPGGMAKCISDVTASSLAQAYWSINYIKVFIRADVLNSATAPAPRQQNSGTFY